MEDNKVIDINSKNQNNLSEDANLIMPQEVEELLLKSHEKIGTIVDIDLESEETNPFKVFRRAFKNRAFDMLWIAIDPEVFSQVTETLIKHRQILDLEETSHKITKVKWSQDIESNNENTKLAA